MIGNMDIRSQIIINIAIIKLTQPPPTASSSLLVMMMLVVHPHQPHQQHPILIINTSIIT
jgi:hypothetical protein